MDARAALVAAQGGLGKLLRSSLPRFASAFQLCKAVQSMLHTLAAGASVASRQVKDTRAALAAVFPGLPATRQCDSIEAITAILSVFELCGRPCPYRVESARPLGVEWSHRGPNVVYDPAADGVVFSSAAAGGDDLDLRGSRYRNKVLSWEAFARMRVSNQLDAMLTVQRVL